MNQLRRRTLRLLLACSLCCGVSVCQSSAPPANASNPPQAAPSAPAKSNKPAATSSSAPTAAKSNGAKAEKKTAPKLTAKQKQAVDMLQAVESDLGRYSPEMQAYLLQQMAQAYQQLDRARQVSLLKEAFQSAANMPEGHYRTEQQTAIVKALNEVDPSALTSMQYSSDPKVREVVLQLLIKQDIEQGKLLAAAQRLSQWDPSLEFPYEYGKQVITRLSAQQAGERQSVFSSAIASYRNGEVKVGPEMGITDFILGTYDEIPVSMVVDAVDLLLNKVARWEQDQQEHVSINTGGKAGHAQFSSLYDLELFELLPVLDKVDPAKADALRRGHATVAALNSKYPNGKSSLSPDGKDFGMMFSSGDSSSPPPGPDPEFLQQRQTADSIAESATRNLDGAIASAQSLPNTVRSNWDVMTLRCRTLEEDGDGCGRKEGAAH